MKLVQKKLIGVAGTISTVLGAMFMFPGFMQERFVLAGFASVLVIGGIVMLSIAFGEESDIAKS
ncbi:MAG: hypothetical protein OXR66_07885 [Candidatus Woesearchaeota archaeon]|nr:hypothetical protein [Candidatus Woesearchaeota archaeon]